MTVTLTIMQAGYCTHAEHRTLRGGQRRTVPFPALFALIEHPMRGPILFDTGYTPRFFEETRQFPYSLYARMTPTFVKPSETALAQLQAQGLAADDIGHIILSHFHADHVAGVADFPQARFFCFEDAYEAVRRKKGIGAVRAGYLAGLLPTDFEQRAVPLGSEGWVALPASSAPFEHGLDILGDRSLLGVRLPGHAHGQMGLFMTTEQWGPVLLAADACWHSRAYRNLLFPPLLTNLIQADARAYRQTLTNLHHLHRNNPEIHIIPSHCSEVMGRYGVPGAR